MEQKIIAGLMQRGFPEHIAKGMAANMIVESGLNTSVNEIAPLVEGSRGGYGLNQWTGPRRRQFEAFAADRGASLSDLNTQLDFTAWELQNTERGAGQALSGAGTAADAARIYSEKFLRPGIPHLDRRIAEANRLAGIAQGQPQGQQGQPQGQAANQFAQMQPPEQKPYQASYAGLDPRMFQTQPQNRLASVGFDQATNPFLAYTRGA